MRFVYWLLIERYNDVYWISDVELNQHTPNNCRSEEEKTETNNGQTTKSNSQPWKQILSIRKAFIRNQGHVFSLVLQKRKIIN